jgi:hypothetical protein
MDPSQPERLNTRLDEAMPVYEFRDVHAIVIRATPDAIFRTYNEVTLVEIGLMRCLFQLRELPARLLGRGEHAPLPAGEPFVAWALGPTSP